MDGSWSTITTGMLYSGRTVGARDVRNAPAFALTSGEWLTTDQAVEDRRNVHGLTRKQLYRRLRAAERQRRELTPEQLWCLPVEQKAKERRETA